jgi:hypothetical protein
VRFGVWIEHSVDWLRVARAPDAPVAMPLVTGAPASSSAWNVTADHWLLGFGFGGDI